MEERTDLLSANQLADIALKEDARLAAVLSRPAPRQQRILRMQNSFLTGAAGTFIDMSLDRRIVTDTIILSADYYVRSNTFPQNIYAAQNHYFRKLMDTWVDVDLRLDGDDNQTISEAPVPLELAFSPTCEWSGPRLITAGSMLEVRAYLRRALSVIGEIPYQITIALRVVQLGGCAWRQMKYSDAVDELVSRGITPWWASCPPSADKGLPTRNAA